MSGKSRPLQLNPELRKAIKEITAEQPNIDQDKLIERIKERRITGMPQAAIRTGVKNYLLNNPKPVAAGTLPNPTNTIEIIENESDLKPKKKVKKNDFLIEFQDNPNYRFQNLGGISQVHKKIQVQLFNPIIKQSDFKLISKLPSNRGFLLSGSPGSGKTIIANCILSSLSKSSQRLISAFSINSYELMGGDAEDKIKKIFQTADQAAPSIIFIDNLEELCNKDNNKRMQSLPSMTLCHYISKYREKQIYLLGATSAPEKMDQLTRPGMFYKNIQINNPDDIQRQEIIEKLLTYYHHNVSEYMKEMVLMTAGYVAVDITSLMKEATLRCIQRTSQVMEDQKQQKIITIEDLRTAVKEVQPILKKDGFAKIPNVKLQDVGALHNIKEELTQEIIMPLREQDKFKNMNFQVSGGGILLYGPPGCGKTMIAKAIANEANANFITVKGPELLTKYVGESEQAVRKVFERARNSAPCIIFFDQFDALAPKRQDQGNQVTQRVVNTLLNELNGVDDRRMVFVIAATNRPDIIDEAVLRSGRIQKHLYVPLPSIAQRLQILIKITRKVNRQEQLDLQDIANRSQNFSGADLYFLVKKSIISAITQSRQKIDANDLKNALKTYKQDKYNKNNRLKLSQFQEEESDKDESISNLMEEGSTSIKKSRSVMEFNQVAGPKEKKKTNQNLLQNFMEYLLQNKRKKKNPYL